MNIISEKLRIMASMLETPDNILHMSIEKTLIEAADEIDKLENRNIRLQDENRKLKSNLSWIENPERMGR